jgi:hypothetical protein
VTQSEQWIKELKISSYNLQEYKKEEKARTGSRLHADQ